MRQVAPTLLLLVVTVGCVGGAVQKRVDVGGYRLTVQAMGQGAPTVVFDAGLGDSKESWRWIWPAVAKRTRVFVYDRAGLGRSESGPLPRTSRQIVDELHTALDRAWVDGPYILVGHSFGGLNMQLFARTYPKEVAALVLLDPTPLEFPEWEAQSRSLEERQRLETSLSLASETLRHELDSVDESVQQVRQAGEPDRIRIVVLSSGRPEEPEWFRESWKQMQIQLAERLSASRHIVIDDSGHYIHFDRPEVVVQTINEIIDAQRLGRLSAGRVTRPPPQSAEGTDRAEARP